MGFQPAEADRERLLVCHICATKTVVFCSIWNFDPTLSILWNLKSTRWHNSRNKYNSMIWCKELYVEYFQDINLSAMIPQQKWGHVLPTLVVSCLVEHHHQGGPGDQGPGHHLPEHGHCSAPLRHQQHQQPGGQSDPAALVQRGQESGGLPHIQDRREDQQQWHFYW